MFTETFLKEAEADYDLVGLGSVVHTPHYYQRSRMEEKEKARFLQEST